MNFDVMVDDVTHADLESLIDALALQYVIRRDFDYFPHVDAARKVESDAGSGH